jgi:hypothetical protein
MLDWLALDAQNSIREQPMEGRINLQRLFS